MSTTRAAAKVASVGECMVELAEGPDGRFTRGFGGDTLNTAIYLARLGVGVDYVTALGNDRFSDEMVAAWAAEGVGTSRILRAAGRLPGLYLIETGPGGERRFSHWREAAPAREMFELPGSNELRRALAGCELIYLSGITLQILPETGRFRLMETLAQARWKGAQVAFDTNFRARGWPEREPMQAAYRAALKEADIVFASEEDLRAIAGPGDGRAWLAHELGTKPNAELVVKRDSPAVELTLGALRVTVAAEPLAGVVDTTAAGDSFAAAYIAMRLAGRDPPDAARFGHRLAGRVVQHRGAIIPREAMADLIAEAPAPIESEDEDDGND